MVPGDRAAYRAAVSPQVDRALVHVELDGSLITWVGPAELGSIGLSVDAATSRAWANLDEELRRCQLETSEIDGVTVAMLDTDFPAKASLILAPHLRETVGQHVGWPVLAVIPDRYFLYLWSAEYQDLIPRLGPIVTREYDRAPYTLTTEIFQIGTAIEAVGAFRTPRGPSPMT